MPTIPESFAACMREVFGAEGDAWLARLPATIEECEQRWSIAIGEPFPGLTYNYATPAVRSDGTNAVFKAGVPVRELVTEMEALRLFDGHGAARLFESDATLGVMLLERLEPGQSLDSVRDDAVATSEAAHVMCSLWRPAPATHLFPTVADWGRGFERLRTEFGGGSGPFPAALVDEAEELFVALTASSAPAMLLHGDLHHGNILSGEREPWLAIDPKGLVGEPAYETGAWLRNPRSLFDQPDPGAILHRRVAQFADELALDRERVRGWGMAQAVLSAWWSYEDHHRGWEFTIHCAELLKERDR